MSFSFAAQWLIAHRIGECNSEDQTKVMPINGNECPICKGTGYNIIEHKREKCSNCDGKGILNKLDCSE